MLASGMAALHLGIATLMNAGDHIVASASLYGGTINLLAHTLPRFGITTTFVKPRALDEFRAIGKRVDLRVREQFSTIPKSPLEIRAEFGTQAVGMAADMRSKDQVEAMVQRAVDEFGGLDSLVTNASQLSPNVLLETVKAGLLLGPTTPLALPELKTTPVAMPTWRKVVLMPDPIPAFSTGTTAIAALSSFSVK